MSIQQNPADVCGERCDERSGVAGAFARQAVQGAAPHEVARVELRPRNGSTAPAMVMSPRSRSSCSGWVLLTLVSQE